MLYDKRWDKKSHTQRSASSIYEDAADLIDERGHSRGLLRNSNGGMCLWGALSYVVTDGKQLADSRASDMLRPLAVMLGGSEPLDAIRWNNALERQKDEVVGLLRRAAAETAAA